MSFQDTLDSVANTVSEHLPDILFGTSMAAGLGATIYGIAITPKALDKVLDWVVENVPEEQRQSLKISELPKLVPWRMKIKLLWKLYLPAGIGWALSLGTGIASEVIHDRREAAYATVAAVAEESLRDFKESTKEVVGDKKYDEIDAAASQKLIDRERAKGDDYIKNNTICINKKPNPFTIIDDITKRRIVLDYQQLEHAQNNLARIQRSYDWASLNDFYYQLGIEPSSIGNDVGWHIMDGEVDIIGPYRGGLDDGVPVGVLHLIDNMRFRTMLGGTEEYLKFRGC